MNNREMAQVVAQRLSERVFEDMQDLIAEITQDVLFENGIDPSCCNDDGDFAWDTLMDVTSRIYIGAN